MINPVIKALFTEPYKRSQEIDETFDKIRVEQGSNAAIEYLKSIGATRLDFKSYVVYHHLDQYTKNNIPLEEREKLLKSLIDNEEVFDVKIERNEEKQRTEITLDTIEGTMHAIKLTEICPELLEKFPELETDGRIGECFYYAYEFMKMLGRPCQMVTGYVYGYTDLSKFLHSWIETKYHGKTYILDGTNNLMIDKEAYYTLRHAQPITKISQKTFFHDMKHNFELFKGIYIPVYLLYRNEIIVGKELTEEKFEQPNGFIKRK